MNAPEKKSAWDVLARPPKTALKQIKGGRLSGMTDINPQWRYKAMHDVFGPCGTGWKYEIQRTWTEQGAAGQVFMFAQVAVYTSINGEWSSSIPGIGGSMLLESQKGQLHHNDEAVKMAVTDALSVALKMLGVGSDIYMGRWDGSKYKDDPQTKTEQLVVAASANGVTPTSGTGEALSDADKEWLQESANRAKLALEEKGVDAAIAVLDRFNLADVMDNQDSAVEAEIYRWTLFDSKTRAAIKKAYAKPTADELTAQA